jgi:hypothetical protein
VSDHADSGEYGLHTNWENCEGGLCCDEALAIMEALVAERDEAREKNAKLSALIVEQESDYRNRKKAAERDLVVQHQRLLDLDETLTAELQAWKVRATEWEKRARPAEAEVARLREALAYAERWIDQSVETTGSTMDELLATTPGNEYAYLASALFTIRAALRGDAITWYPEIIMQAQTMSDSEGEDA